MCQLVVLWEMEQNEGFDKEKYIESLAWINGFKDMERNMKYYNI